MSFTAIVWYMVKFAEISYRTFSGVSRGRPRTEILANFRQILVPLADRMSLSFFLVAISLVTGLTESFRINLRDSPQRTCM